MRSGRHDASLLRRGILLVSAFIAIGAPIAGCSSVGFDGNVYRGKDSAFRVITVPAEWQRIQVSNAAVAWRDPHGGMIATDTRCHEDGGDVPLASLTQHLFLGFTEREIIEQKVVPFDGREAMHTILTAKLDGVPKKFDMWVMKKDDCVYDLYYVAAPAQFELGVATFERFVQGFATVPVHAD